MGGCLIKTSNFFFKDIEVQECLQRIALRSPVLVVHDDLSTLEEIKTIMFRYEKHERIFAKRIREIRKELGEKLNMDVMFTIQNDGKVLFLNAVLVMEALRAKLTSRAFPVFHYLADRVCFVFVFFYVENNIIIIILTIYQCRIQKNCVYLFDV